jgi:predicted enzyme related to lactoylglutathione lyase
MARERTLDHRSRSGDQVLYAAVRVDHPGFSDVRLHLHVVKLKGAEQGQGGLMPIPSHAKGMPPAWFPYVTVDNVEATAKQAVQLGGKVLVEPKDIPEVGRFAVIQDPQGAAISIITYLKKRT